MMNRIQAIPRQMCPEEYDQQYVPGGDLADDDIRLDSKLAGRARPDFIPNFNTFYEKDSLIEETLIIERKYKQC